MIIGLIGASRTGKTTLARRLAEDFNFTFHQTSISESAKAIGIDPVAPMSLRQRVMLQQHLLIDFVGQVEQIEGPVIVDRTPIDMAGYLLAEFHMQSHLTTDEELQQQVVEYVDTCVTVMNSRFLAAMICRPLPHYEVVPTSSPYNPAFQLHSQLVMEGLALRVNRRCKIVHYDSTDFDERVDQGHTFLSHILRAAEEHRNHNLNVH